MVVVDRLTKFSHFITISHPYTAVKVEELFIDYIFKLYGLPKSIVTDHGPIFISSFWKTLFTMQGSTLNFNSTYYPQSDGQTETLNKCLKNYLHCYTGQSADS